MGLEPKSQFLRNPRAITFSNFARFSAASSTSLIAPSASLFLVKNCTQPFASRNHIYETFARDFNDTLDRLQLTIIWS